jgi:hypothetical protein
MHASGNLAGRMGRWSARHRRTAAFGWLAFVVSAVGLGSLIPRGQLTTAEQLVGPAAQAQRTLDEHGWKHGDRGSEPAADPGRSLSADRARRVRDRRVPRGR